MNVGSAFVCLAVVFLQVTSFAQFAPHDAGASLLMIPLAYALRRDGMAALRLAAVCGLAEDILSVSGFAWTLGTMAAAYAFVRIADIIELERPLVFCGAIALATFVRDLAFWTIRYVDGYPAFLLIHTLHVCLWNTCFTAVAAFCVVKVSESVQRRRPVR